MKARLLLIATLLLSTLAFAGPVSAACDPGRASGGYYRYQADYFAQPGVWFYRTKAQLDIQQPFVESGSINQHLQIDGPGSAYARVGVAYGKGTAPTLFLSLTDTNGNYRSNGVQHYSITPGSDRAWLEIVLAPQSNGSTIYRFYNGTYLLASISMAAGQDWVSSQISFGTATSNTGNQNPGESANLSYFRTPTYTSQYGTATVSFQKIEIPYRIGHFVSGQNEFGYWTRDYYC